MQRWFLGLLGLALCMSSTTAAAEEAPAAEGAPASEAPADDNKPAEPVAKTQEQLDLEKFGDPNDGDVMRWGFAATPKIIINSDTGFGLGVRGNAFFYRWGQKPYKTKIGAQVYMTTRLIQEHWLTVDAIDAFNLPIRILSEVGYYQNVVQNFCGFGNQTTCDRDVAMRKAQALPLNPAERVDFARRYYQHRYIRPYARAEARWRFNQKPHKVELFGGWRGHYYQTGDWFDHDGDGAPDLHPYPGSMYDEMYPDGDNGFASVLQLGIMFDNRDHEPAPSKGYWIELSARAATIAWGSKWNYGGVNATVRTYSPLMGKTLVFAQRLVADVTMGDMPLQEMVRIGGSFDYTAFGGREIGRGIRVQRFPGRLKFLTQHEVRHNLPSFTVLNQELQFGFAAFLDAGLIGHDWSFMNSFTGRAPDGWNGDPLGVALGAGVSLRFIWNQNFVMRLDIAFSPSENYMPGIYSGPDHPF